MNQFNLDNDTILLKSEISKYDTDIFGFNVAFISDLEVKKNIYLQEEYNFYNSWLVNNSIKIVSCRLESSKLQESFFLEKNDFRFIETVLHPVLMDLHNFPYQNSGLDVLPANQNDIDEIKFIAENAFGFERYHTDPRFDNYLADKRYGVWVENSFKEDSSQVLLKVLNDKHAILAFFIVEQSDDNSIYWHLTAVNPKFQNMGLGYEIWSSVINYHKSLGSSSIHTTISARNFRVLNLYSKLNFRFKSPDNTFHLFLK
jgi:RimJ/RimL family protein N-acetyltransferase